MQEKLPEGTVHAILVRTRALIAKPANWTQGTAARDRLGFPVSPRNSEAVCWCLSGALCKVCLAVKVDITQVLCVTHAAIQLHSEHIGIHAFNDAMGRTHADVLQLLDKLIDVTV